MRFRPCIDIHNGKVKQIVGGSLVDLDNQATENFVAEQEASFFAKLYRDANLYGGHIVLLNPQTSEYYEASKAQAFEALREYPGGLQIGGGITADNAMTFITAGASHVIVTSYAFSDGQISYSNIKKLSDTVGRERLVLDLSCRKKDDGYYIVTDRWQKFTQTKITEETLQELAKYCDEFLIHAVDVEGKASGIETELVQILASYDGIPITYAGGVGSLVDLLLLKEIGKNKIDVTVGSALDLFGGVLKYEEVQKACENPLPNVGDKGYT